MHSPHDFPVPAARTAAQQHKQLANGVWHIAPEPSVTAPQTPAPHRIATADRCALNNSSQRAQHLGTGLLPPRSHQSTPLLLHVRRRRRHQVKQQARGQRGVRRRQAGLAARDSLTTALHVPSLSLSPRPPRILTQARAAQQQHRVDGGQRERRGGHAERFETQSFQRPHHLSATGITAVAAGVKSSERRRPCQGLEGTTVESRHLGTRGQTREDRTHRLHLRLHARVRVRFSMIPATAWWQGGNGRRRLMALHGSDAAMPQAVIGDRECLCERVQHGCRVRACATRLPCPSSRAAETPYREDWQAVLRMAITQ